MKIKQKKQLSLPQLIEWLLESGESECIVISNMNNIVRLEPYGVIRFSQEKFYPEEFFTVTIEEEITEDTKFCELVVKDIDGMYSDYSDISISDFLLSRIRTIYMLNKDDTLTLIWKDGKLI